MARFTAAIAASLRRYIVHCLMRLAHTSFAAEQHPHVLALGRLTDAELFRDQEAADAVLDQVAVDLLAKMFSRLAQPFQDLQPPFVGQRAQRHRDFHLAILLIT